MSIKIKERDMLKWIFSFLEDKHKTRNEKARLPRVSKGTTNKPKTLYTFYDSTKPQKKKVCLP